MNTSSIMMMMIGYLIMILLLLATQATSSFSFNISSLRAGNRRIHLEGDASLSSQGLELTINQVNRDIASSLGRASFETPVQLWDPRVDGPRSLASFTTHFSFSIRMIGNSTDTGDGMTFFLAPFGDSYANYSAGENLGIINWPDPVTNRTDNRSFVAVEFDTYWNWFDPSDQHVGIDIGSVVSVTNVTWTNGSMTDGRVANAWVRYDSGSQNLSVYLTYDRNPVFRERYCVLWYQVDLRLHLPETVRVGFTASTGRNVETHTVYSWAFNSTLALIGNDTSSGAPTPSLEAPPSTSSGGTSNGLAIGLGAGLGAVVVLGVGVIILLYFKKRANGTVGDIEEADEEEEEEGDDSIDGEFGMGAGPKRFTYHELRVATRDFSEDGKLGEGGFGGVYKGLLGGAVGEVAVKRISKASKQGQKEYVSEVRIISRLRHRNLVRLIGWCHKQGEFLLVYEYLPNGSLDSHLFGDKVVMPMPWTIRYKIGQGLASALLYLHDEWEQCVVHRDIKSSNVLLDTNFNAKLGDFGLARLVDHEYSLHTVAFAGTMGYIAPECVETGKSSRESDVYSFGVVALELSCGRRSIVPNVNEPNKVKLVNWVWELYGRGQLIEAVDKRLNMEFDAKEIECLMIVGLWCCHPDPNFRPTMKQVMNVLNFEAPLPNNLPKELPRPMYATSINISLDSYTTWGFTGMTTDSSNSTMDSTSKPLLKLTD